MEQQKLTELTTKPGCSCKIAAHDLQEILAGSTEVFDHLVAGHGTMDDAAVTDWDDDQYLLHTVDFFTPMVDHAGDFGSIAAANALSDVYAMGGKPMVALGILGWPVDRLGTEMASEVVMAARKTCQQAHIPLAGGHSIESQEPFFGVSVTGSVLKSNLKTNAMAKAGDVLILSKPLGSGMLSTAFKRGMLSDQEVEQWMHHMKRVNSVGALLGETPGVHAMTDVTGFGLLGHLLELCQASTLSATLELSNIPSILPEKCESLMKEMVMPDNTMRNFKSYSQRVDALNAREIQLLCDPQTNGGLLISVDPSCVDDVQSILRNNGDAAAVIGTLESGKPHIHK